MKILSDSARPLCALCVALSAICAAGLCLPNDVTAAENMGAAVMRVEEDWELVVKSPDENSAGPQIACTISPYSDADFQNATFELNHQSLPSFVAGGIQLQTWEDTYPMDSRKFPKAAVLQHDGEIVRWTQTMRISNGVLGFEIVGGSSLTWGAFGGQGYLKSSMSTDLDNLNAYSPFVSARHSGIGYGANLVSSLVLKRVRLTYANGETVEYAKPICVCDGN